MGAEASKPMVKPPSDWDPPGAKKSFEVISPCSDLSNPSDFNRVRYNRNSRQYQLTQGNRHPSQTLSRNASQNKKSGDYNPHELPVAVKVRRSNSTSGNSDGDIIAPGAFYFPTKESERQADYLAKKESKKNDGKIIFKRTNSNQVQNKKGKMKTFRSLARKTAKKMKRRKDTLKRIALAVGHACLDESRNKAMLDKENTFNATNQRPEMETSRRTMDRKHNGSLRSRRRSEQIARGDLQASKSRHQVPLSQFKKDGNKMKTKGIIGENSTKNMERHQTEMDRVNALALHQADVYFDRLSLTTGKSHEASPFVGRGASDNRITSILESTSKTPKNHTQRSPLDSTVDTPVSDLFSAHNSVPKMQDSEYSSSKDYNASPVSSLMLFYTKSGPLDSTPKSYCSNGDDVQAQMFTDESNEESIQRRHITYTSKQLNQGRESQDSGNSLYTNESKSYKQVNGNNLKLLSYPGPQKNQDPLHSYARTEKFVRAEKVKAKPRKTNKQEPKEERHQKVSKLESLFRPIMPALSTDDAQSLYSYDPYEIKVTESAPGAIQAVSLGFRKTSPRNANDESASAARLSMDSQRERTSIGKHMVSDQALDNGEFLFANDYGPVVRAKKTTNVRDSASFSISTAGSRSRLAQKATQKGVSIKMKKLGKESDDVSFDSRSTRSERRVRFSEGSFRTRLLKKREEVLDKEHPFDESDANEERRELVEEKDDTKILRTKSFEGNDNDPAADKTENGRYEKYQTHTKHHTFGPGVARNVTRINSVDESIDLPEIESKGSDISEGASNTSRKSFESAPSVRSNHSIPDKIPEEDEMTAMSRDSSVHWSKTQNGVTPFVRGKSTAEPTKSPYFRYQDAKTKFNALKAATPKLSPKKARSPQKAKSPKKSPSKSPGSIMRKGSGGLVSMRIQELNTRVSEVRKLKRMRKKTTNPRLHTHNFDNTQPLRSRALINYKTISTNAEKSNNMMAAKFNTIPNMDDDDDSTAFLPESGRELILSPRKEHFDDDDISRMSEITGATMATVRQPRGSVATIRQQRNSVATVRQQQRILAIPQQRDSYEGSTTSRSTASSGLTRLKKQVFRNSDAARSIASTGENTTLSAMLQKENADDTHKTMLAPPTIGTPAMKWRTLAAAAAEKDALKTNSTKPSRKKVGLRTRNMNVQQSYEIYGFKD